MSLACNSVSLSLGVLRVHGADALTFLQGQVSNDVMRLTPSQALLAGYHNPQGRVIALLRLVQLAPADVLAILPRELAPAVAARLAKFILRAKVQVSDASAQWSVTGLLGGNAVTAAGEGWPQTPDGAARRGESIAVRLAGVTPRGLLPRPGAPPPPARHGSACRSLPGSHRSTRAPRRSSSPRCSTSMRSAPSTSTRAAIPARK